MACRKPKKKQIFTQKFSLALLQWLHNFAEWSQQWEFANFRSFPVKKDTSVRSTSFTMNINYVLSIITFISVPVLNCMYYYGVKGRSILFYLNNTTLNTLIIKSQLKGDQLYMYITGALVFFTFYHVWKTKSATFSGFFRAGAHVFSNTSGNQAANSYARWSTEHFGGQTSCRRGRRTGCCHPAGSRRSARSRSARRPSLDQLDHRGRLFCVTTEHERPLPNRWSTRRRKPAARKHPEHWSWVGDSCPPRSATVHNSNCPSTLFHHHYQSVVIFCFGLTYFLSLVLKLYRVYKPSNMI